MSTGRGGGAAFNIGSQQAGAIYQSAGDQFIYDGGGQLSAGVLTALSDLRAVLASASAAMQPSDAAEAQALLATVEHEAKQPGPDKQRIGAALTGIARNLKRAGRLAEAATALHQLAVWLGPAGAALLALL
jgi:hypothetical protein